MKYKTIGVIGAGVIGVGVAQSLAQTGHRVILVDIDDDILARARNEIKNNLKFAALFDKVIRADDHARILANIEYTQDYSRLSETNFVVENSTEKWSVKEAVYPRLHEVCPPACIFAANTSAIPITRLAALTGRPDKVLGMHFMNPVPQIGVVEVIRSEHSSVETIQAAGDFLQQLGKRAIVVNDVPGFVSNRVLMLTINEAVLLVQHDVAGAGDIDEIFVKCFGHKMGPLATADLIGLDTVLLTLEVLYECYNDDKYHPSPLLKEMVAAGLHGRKSGKGFFEYS